MHPDPSGRIHAPAAVSHQDKETEKPIGNPVEIANAAAFRSGVLLGREVEWQEFSPAYRFLPGDDLPVIAA